MVEPPGLRDVEYQRGQAILRRWGWPAGIVGTLGLLTFLGVMFDETKHPDPQTGHVYAIVSLSRHTGLFTYGTYTDAVIAYGGLAVAVLGLTTYFVLRRLHNPDGARRKA